MSEVNIDFKGYIQSDLWRSTNEVREIQQKVQNFSCEVKALFLRHQVSALSWHAAHQRAMLWTVFCCFQVTLQMKPGVCCWHGVIYPNSWSDRLGEIGNEWTKWLSINSFFWGFDCIPNCYSEKQYKQINVKIISFSNLVTYFSI